MSEQSKQELTLKYSNLEKEFLEYRRQSDTEISQIVKALQSDFEFELEKLRCEHQETLQKLHDERIHQQISTNEISIQTESIDQIDEETSISIDVQDEFIQTESIDHSDQSIQTTEEFDDTTKRSISKDQQTQFNLAIQRAVQNATHGQKRQIIQLEQQLNDKRTKISKLKECIKNLQNFYTLSSTSPPPSSTRINPMNDGTRKLPSVSNSLITSSTDEEQSTKEEENPSTPDENSSRTTFFKRSEPISMPSTFLQSVLAATNSNSIQNPPTKTFVHQKSLSLSMKR